MQNPFRGIIEIALDRPRHLRFTLNSIIAFQGVTGVDLLDGAAMKAAKKDVTFLRALLWAGLIHEDDSLSIERVGAFVDTGDIVRLWQKVSEALAAAISQRLGEAKAAPGKAEPGAAKSGRGLTLSASRSARLRSVPTNSGS